MSRVSRGFERFIAIFATNSLVARLPPLPIEVTRHRQGSVVCGAGAFALLLILLTLLGTAVGLAMPIEARKLNVVIFNVDAVARAVALLDQPVTAYITRDFYRGRRLRDGVGVGGDIHAHAACGHAIFIPPIGQSSATIAAIDTPIYAEVVFVWVRARGHAHAVFDFPAPTVRPAVMLAHPVQILAPVQGVLTKLTIQYVKGG